MIRSAVHERCEIIDQAGSPIPLHDEGRRHHLRSREEYQTGHVHLPGQQIFEIDEDAGIDADEDQRHDRQVLLLAAVANRQQ